MSVPNSLLAILADEPAHGYSLKSSFENRTGGAWPLNVGQVYTTLKRLERDGLVESVADDDEARRAWNITGEGRSALAAWFESPVDDGPSRDELVIKVLLAIAYESVDARTVIQGQRIATMKRLQSYTQRKLDADPEADLPWILLLDALILRTDAEARWLDLCDERLGAPSEVDR